MHDLGIEPSLPPTPPVIMEVVPDEAAFRAGMQVGDTVVKVNGKEIHDWHDFVRVSRTSANIPMHLGGIT